MKVWDAAKFNAKILSGILFLANFKFEATPVFIWQLQIMIYDMFEQFAADQIAVIK